MDKPKFSTTRGKVTYIRVFGDLAGSCELEATIEPIHGGGNMSVHALYTPKPVPQVFASFCTMLCAAFNSGTAVDVDWRKDSDGTLLLVGLACAK